MLFLAVPLKYYDSVFTMSFCQIIDYFAYLINRRIKFFRDLICGIM